MKYAIISDIHGNYEALKTVLADIRRRSPDRRICLGDIVGYGPMPGECLKAVRDFDLLVMGNHDAAVVDLRSADTFNFFARYSIEWSASVLSPEEKTFLGQLPPSASESHFLLVHATPSDMRGFPYIMYLDEAMDAFRAFDLPVCFFGHTHLPGVFTSTGHLFFPEKLRLEKGSRYLVNAGSVGQPRNLDPRACYVLYDDKKREVEFIRLPYDIEATREAMAERGLPAFLSARLLQGR